MEKVEQMCIRDRDIILRAGIGKTYVLEFKQALGIRKVLWIFGIVNLRLRIDYICNTVCRNRSTGEHDEHHGHHEEGHNNLHCVLHERHHITDLHGRGCDLVRAHPNDEDGNPVHNKRHNRVQPDHDTTDEQRSFCKVFICLVKTVELKILRIERPDDHEAVSYTHLDVYKRQDVSSIKTVLGYDVKGLADPKVVKQATGYEAGRIPLVGHNLPILFDKQLTIHDFIYGGTGDEFHTLKIRPEDVIRLNNMIDFIE